MLDLKYIRENTKEVKTRIEKRGVEFLQEIDTLISLDSKRRGILTEVETLKSEKNTASKLIGELKRNMEDATEIVEEVNGLTEKIKGFEIDLEQVDSKISHILMHLPNLPALDVPRGTSEEDNVVVKTVGAKTKFDFTPKPHYEIGESLDILDFEAGARITGSRFTVLKNDGARLERALIAFMMDVHTQQNGYDEYMLPYIISRDTMTRAGKLPKFEEDSFKFDKDQDWFLNSTAEIPLVGYFANQVLDLDSLPVKIAGFTTAFRREAGSAGRDTRGLMRQHQFNKVELFKVVHPNESNKELAYMLSNAEKILELLKIPYRVVDLCVGDLSDGNCRTFDIEVYLPAFDEYREISSVSNAESFQAIRGNIKFRGEDNKLHYAHTLNGSGLAVGRTMIAILENYQTEDGNVTIPDVLVPYMGKNLITKK